VSIFSSLKQIFYGVTLSLSSKAQYNHLFAVMPQDAVERLIGATDLVDLIRGQVLCESGLVCDYVYFPTTAIVSIIYMLEDGAAAEVAMVGNEGVVGISHFLGGGFTTSHAVVQIAGQCMRLKTKAITEEFKRMGHFMNALLCYTQALITQTTQNAVCYRHHTIDQRLCRWLLRSIDSVNGSSLAITQEQIANMLGVRREGVTQAAAKLQIDGLIKCERGSISLIDRHGIEDRVCECYAVVRKEYRRLLPSLVGN
jgi:CRP-like cAMP-binding protein